MPASKWDMVKEKLILIEGWARDGLTDEQIAFNLGIHVATLYRYKNEHDDLCEVLKRGKEVVDRQVENALLKRALGYQVTEIKTSTNPDGSMFVTETIKEVQPDTTAQIFWLKNRKPEAWRDKKEVETTGETTVNNKIDLSNLTYDQLKELVKDES